MATKRLKRPIAVDVREWREITMSALNEIGVGVGQEFLLTTCDQAPSRRRPDENANGAARRSDPKTSKQAAVGVYPRSGSQRHSILMAIAHSGSHGITAEEASKATGIEYRSATPRIGELKNGGWVKGTGRTRPGDYGAEQEVLIPTDRGWEWITGREGFTDGEADEPDRRLF